MYFALVGAGGYWLFAGARFVVCECVFDDLRRPLMMARSRPILSHEVSHYTSSHLATRYSLILVQCSCYGKGE